MLQQPSQGMGLTDVPVFHILHHVKISEKNEVISLIQSLEPFIQHYGAFRWAALLTLASLVEHLPDLQLLKLLDCDIVYMEKYLTHYSDEDQANVMCKFQSFLLVSDNREFLNEKAFRKQLLYMHITEDVSKRKEFLKSVIDAYDTHTADLLENKEAKILTERLNVTLQQCRCAITDKAPSQDLLKSTELLLIECRRKIIDPDQVLSVLVLLLPFMTEYFSGG